MGPHKSLLDRAKAAQESSQFAPQIGVLEDMVDFGTNLVVRVFHVSERKLEDFVVVTVLTKQAVQMLDGITVLLSSGCVHAASVQIRSILELCFQVEWILKDRMREKALAYWGANLMRQLERARDFLPESEFRKRRGRDLNGGQYPWPEEQEVRRRVKELESELDSDEMRPIRDALFQMRWPVWHRALGCRSIRAMATDLGRTDEYDYLYGFLSGIAHGSTPHAQIEGREQELAVLGLRNVGRMPEAIELARSLILRLFRVVLGHYREEEIKNLSRKYREQWHPVLAAMPVVREEDEVDPIG